MFTGLIETVGTVADMQLNGSSARLIINTKFDNLQSGESIAINGVCLTLLPDSMNQLIFDVSSETLQCTTLGRLAPGDKVNIERAMSASNRFGGHYVSGHVDTSRPVEQVTAKDDYLELVIGGMTQEDKKLLLPKGSITVDGVSLTINAVEGERIKLMLVPHTIAQTIVSIYRPGMLVNIEFDHLTKMVAHQINFAIKGIQSESVI